MSARRDDKQAIEMKAWLRERREVQAILPGGRADTQFAGAPIEVLGLPDHATYRDQWPLLQQVKNAWVRIRAGDAAFISEQLARRQNLAIGDRIEVPRPAATGRSKSSASMPTTAIPRARSRSTTPR